MTTVRESSVNDPTARKLLEEYFAYRAAVFPVADGYRAVPPDAVAFTPPHGVFLLIEHAGEAVGCGGIRALDEARFEVKHVWVRPECRRLGLSKTLMAELERRARELGATELVLDTHETLEAANALYRGLGFDQVAAYNDNPNASRWYRKALSAQ